MMKNVPNPLQHSQIVSSLISSTDAKTDSHSIYRLVIHKLSTDSGDFSDI